MTNLYCTYFDSPLPSDVFKQLVNDLPEDIIYKANKFHRWQDAHAHLYGKLLVKQMIVDFDLKIQVEDLKYTNFQRPYFDIQNFDFNISHSGKYVLCIGSDEFKVGIDIEEIRKIDFADLKSQFHEDEWAEILGAKNMIQAFYVFWTRKEALAKADGAGLSLSFSKLNATSPSNVVLVNGSRWFIKEIKLHPFYECSIASSGRLKHLKVKYVSPKKLSRGA